MMRTNQDQLQIIETLRKELNLLVARSGCLGDEKVIKLSQELDECIIKYQRMEMRKRNTDRNMYELEVLSS